MTSLKSVGGGYKHTQAAKVILWVTLCVAALMAGISITVAKQAGIGFGVLLLCAWLFNSLTIEIGGGELRWRFGPGLIRKRVALANITSVRVVRTNVFEGWGIHLTRFGWLYNVSGFDAVAITLRNGKRFALGADEAEALARALNENLSQD